MNRWSVTATKSRISTCSSGPRGTAAETAFCNALTNNKDGFTSLLAVIAPNLQCKPNTILFNKVTIKGAKQAVQMFGPAQHAVAKAVQDSVADGVIPADEADDVFICVGVFIHWDAADDAKIQKYNYGPRRKPSRAVEGKPTAAEATAQRTPSLHPFGAKSLKAETVGHSEHVNMIRPSHEGGSAAAIGYTSSGRRNG